ncbi:MBL fold metallo-hydrolase [uncultured Marivita sp.]|uniref:MBL fold metallo-hydrolase n=1 Tax=uncultured Marivita sp. TaxID=888080 RepID=UPI00262C0200|nr:MBL fold metallo-hydrolase [uncultured Marivita sp.]
MSIVIPLHDGGFAMEQSLFPALASQPEEATALIGAPFPSHFDIPVWAFAIQDARGWSLVDTGGGAMMGAGFGGVHTALNAAGINAGDITRIYLTHLHGDHCGGLLDSEESAAFPAARVALPEAERAFWFGPHVPPEMGQIAEDARRALHPYGDRVDPVSPEDLVGAARAIDAVGHTPGHTAWAFEESDLLAVGDILHLAPLQLWRPEIASIWDMDCEAAVATRRAFIRRARKTGATLLCAHGGAIPATEIPDE